MASLECAGSTKDCDAASAVCDHLRIVLLGKTGTGRSSSGNTILGRQVFRVDVSPRSVTAQCERQTGEVCGRSISLVDTPGLFHTGLSPREVTSEVGRCVTLSAPGPHAFLVTLPATTRFTQEDRDALDWLRATFGPGASQFTLVLFTWGDQVKDKHVDDFLRESDELSAFVRSCRGGCHTLDNSQGLDGENPATGRSQQANQLLEKVDAMVAQNGGGCYSNEMFQEAERAIAELQERILGGREQEDQGPGLERTRKTTEEEGRREEEAARKRAEKLFWCELVTALGKGAAEGAGIIWKDEGKGKALKKAKVVEKAAALVATPLSISSAVKMVGGAVREGSKVLYKHRNTLLH